MTDYKSTLNLPKTSFPMKGNLSQSEPAILNRWEQGRLYDHMLSRRAGAEPFILHDGPPYANGDIHMGHALNKVLKDFIVRFENLRGKRAPYVPGWDCHGLPIEYALMKELAVTKHQVDTVEFRRAARAYALKYVSLQREQFKRLGCLGQWEDPYLTLEPSYVTTALAVLKKLVENGFVYRARKPVNWCWSCETALAEAEVEYEQHTSPSIYVKFELDPKEIQATFLSAREPIQRAYLVIWTTTPWTLMGNVAVAVHPQFEYALWKREPGEVWVTLSSLPEATLRDLEAGPDRQNVLATTTGRQLQSARYRHPFLSREGQVVLAEYVSREDGTGLVHTAPGFGAEDFTTGKRYGLEVLAPVDSKGRFAGLPKEAAQFNGQPVQAANPGIVELLKKRGLLVKSKELEHPYPHCWRCREPILFRATDQWFLNVEKDGLRQKLLEVAAHEVQWIPPEGKERITGMLTTRPDWCLSRQRLWGIPIPAVTCAACGEGILDPRIIENFSRAIENDPEGSDRWFTEPVTRWLPKDFACAQPACRGREFKIGADILDVWFDSGVSHEAVLKRRPGLGHPADLYLEGSDQHRGWFQVSLITAVALSGQAPYRAVFTHGFVVDGEGRKMSKSLGNVIAPQEVVSSLGADVLRLWVASSDYREDVRLSPTILAQAAETYRKIRNTLRFCLANLLDFKPASGLAPERMESLDRWMVSELDSVIAEVTKAYEERAFHRVIKAIHEFCVGRLSNFYLDVVKDCLYTFHPKDPKRLSVQTTLYQIAQMLIHLVAPILPMTSEEAWAALSPDDGGSIHLKEWPKERAEKRDPSLNEEWRHLLEFRDQAMKALEKAREEGTIGDSLEAELEVTVGTEEGWLFLQPRQEKCALTCIVSVFKLIQGKNSGEPLLIQVRRAPGTKCQRCWMRLPTVGSHPKHPALCHRCVEVLERLTIPAPHDG